MSLTVAYNIAREGLAVGGTASSIVSRNLANADNPNAGRKSIWFVTDTGAGVRAAGILGAVDNVLFEQAVASSSARTQLEAMSSALDQLTGVIGDPEMQRSPAGLIGVLRQALQTSAGAPQSDGSARAVVVAAAAVSNSLNAAAGTVSKVRADANASIADGVENCVTYSGNSRR